jgi:hypothetical protein
MLVGKSAYWVRFVVVGHSYSDAARAGAGSVWPVDGSGGTQSAERSIPSRSPPLVPFRLRNSEPPIREKFATRIRLREEWKPEMSAACVSIGSSRPSAFRDLNSLGAYISRSFATHTEMSDEF